MLIKPSDYALHVLRRDSQSRCPRERGVHCRADKVSERNRPGPEREFDHL